jgi:hypothetical protein
MATNLVALNVYQINSSPVNVGGVLSKRIAFPTQGVLVQDCSTSPARSLSTGFNVYSTLQTPNGTLFYVTETTSAIVTLFNA